MSETGGGVDQAQTGDNLTSGFLKDRVLLPPYDELSIEDRKKWLDYLIGKPLRDAGKPLRVAMDQEGGDYRYYSLNPDDTHTREYLKKYNRLEGLLWNRNQGKVAGYLRDHPEMLDAVKKLHLQPGIPQALKVIQDFAALLVEKDAVHKSIPIFKVRLDQLSALTRRSESEPFIVVYPYHDADMAMLQTALQEKFKGYEPTPEESMPRYNQRVGTVVFSATGEGHLKWLMAGNGLLDRYYDKSTNYATVRPDVQHAPPSLSTRLISFIKRS